MNSHQHSFEDLQDRLAALENQNRRFKQLGAALLIVVTSLIVMGQASSKKTVEADEFIVRDSSGKVRIKLAVDTKSGAPEINLFDAEGKARVKLEAGFLPGLSLYDSQERHRGTFATNDILGSSVLMLMHADGKSGTLTREDDVFSSEVATLQATSNEFILMDDSGNKRARLFMTKKKTENITLPGTSDSVPMTFNPTHTLTLYDEKAQTKVMLDSNDISFLNAKGSLGGQLGSGLLTVAGDGGTSGAMMVPGQMAIFDAEGFSAVLGVTTLGTPHTGETHRRSAASLVLFDKNRNVIWKVP